MAIHGGGKQEFGKAAFAASDPPNDVGQQHRDGKIEYRKARVFIPKKECQLFDRAIDDVHGIAPALLELFPM